MQYRGLIDLRLTVYDELMAKLYFQKMEFLHVLDIRLIEYFHDIFNSCLDLLITVAPIHFNLKKFERKVNIIFALEL